MYVLLHLPWALNEGLGTQKLIDSYARIIGTWLSSSKRVLLVHLPRENPLDRDAFALHLLALAKALTTSDLPISIVLCLRKIAFLAG